MTPADLARQTALDTSLSTGRLSRMSYVVKCMQLAEERAEALIRATPEAQGERLLRQAEDQAGARPKSTPRRHHWQD